MNLQISIPEEVKENDYDSCPICNHEVKTGISFDEPHSSKWTYCTNCSWTGGVWLPRLYITG